MSNRMISRITAFALVMFKTFCSAIILFAMLFTIWAVGPEIETRYFPVVSKLTILDARADEDGNTVLDAEFTKIRNCEYLGLAWFRALPGGMGFERVPVEIMRQENDTSSPNRPTGTQRAGPWIVHMTPDDLRNRSFSRLMHRCHGLWVTTTDFFP